MAGLPARWREHLHVDKEVRIQVMWMWPMETDSHKLNKCCHGEGPSSNPSNLFRGGIKNGVMKDHRGPWRPYGDVVEGSNGCNNEERAADNAVNALCSCGLMARGYRATDAGGEFNIL
jgi:hypothetical protein